ncbi:MAG: GNAT family N-acetyltransferase [Oscillospiraceae bacterium]|jgi:GNAT superfamily N-acetyltransferase|nr:GNAT family N-acetyltransferase [Oscillospiraceae bacterium]
MIVKPCTTADCAELARLNKQLLEDEGNEKPVTIEGLYLRMEDFLAGEYQAVFFEQEKEVVGYALVRMTSSPLYLRQFFICRAHRRQGYGREAFGRLLEYLDTDEVDIEVLMANAVGLAFWQSLGFYQNGGVISMRYRGRVNMS